MMLLFHKEAFMCVKAFILLDVIMYVYSLLLWVSLPISKTCGDPKVCTSPKTRFISSSYLISMRLQL